MMKKLISVILIIVLVFSILPYSVYANEREEAVEGGLSEEIDAKDSIVEPKGSTLPSRAIVIIPGIMGSTLKNSNTNRIVWADIFNLGEIGQIALNENGSSVYSLVPYNDNSVPLSMYTTLFSEMEEKYSYYADVCDVVFFPYDWRMNNSNAAIQLAAAVADYSEIVIIAHSMGGLVASRFLANSAANRAKTVALITIGTPFVGSAKCINVMETGELLDGIFTEYMLEDTVKSVCINSYAAYQLLPTTSYYSYTGHYPIYVNGSNVSNCYTALANAAWGKTSSSTTKSMFQAASTFHTSLGSGTNHIIYSSGVPIYTLAGLGEVTIRKVELKSDYTVSYLYTSTSGDGTVLTQSAGHGNPYKIFTSSNGYSIEHSDLVKNPEVIAEIKRIIYAETGMRASDLDTASASAQAYTGNSTPSLNARGWIVGQDNKRIVLVINSEDTLWYNDAPISEAGEAVFDSNGNAIGNVWKLGNTNRKQYILVDGAYEVNCNSGILIEFMDSGYYDAVYEYDLSSNGSIYISGYGALPICTVNGNTQSAYVYSQEELAERNQD